MPKKDRAVVFTSNNAIVLKNPSNIEHLKALPNVLINPDFGQVRGVKPQYWSREGNKLVPLSEDLKIARDLHIAQNGVDNLEKIKKDEDLPKTVYIERPIYVRDEKSKYFLLLAFVGGTLVGSLITALTILGGF